jgi:hypothetical protein
VREPVLGQSVCPQETGDLHTLAATLLNNVRRIIFSSKIGKVKNKKGKPPERETHGAIVRHLRHKQVILPHDVQNITTWAQGLLAWYFPDPHMCELVGFVVGVRVVLGMVVGPVLGFGIPIVAKLIL